MPFVETLYCPECYRSLESGHGYCPEHGARLVLLPAEESLVGAVVAEVYRIEAELGAGGAGVTYRAAHTVIDRPIALKVFRRFLADDAAAARRFDADADAALQLKGRHTVQVYDAGRTRDGRLFLARAFVDGPTLAELVAASGPMAPARALRAALGVARALEYAHARGVVHRGLSPSNIFLVQADGEEIAKVADFGQAGALTRDDGISLRPEGLAIRPLEYLSPEQAVGASCDVAADLYGLGVVLYEALTGRPPFTAPTPVELLLAHAQDPPPRFADVNPDVDLPPKVEALVRELLAKQPRQRPASASVLAAELEVLLKDPAVAGKSPAPVGGPSRADSGHAPSGPVVPPTTAPESGRDAPPTGAVDEPCEISPEPGGIVASPTPPSFPPPEHGLTDPVGSAAVLLPRKSKLPWFIGGGVLALIAVVVGLFASGVISQKPAEPEVEAEAASPPASPADVAPDPGGEVSRRDGGEAAPPPDLIEEIAAPDIIEEIAAPDIIEEIAAPDIIEEVAAPDVIEEVAAPDIIEEVAAPDIIEEIAAPDLVDEVATPDITEEVATPDVDEDKKPPREDKKPPREDRKPPREDKKPPVEDKKPPVEDRKPPVEDKKPPVEDKKPPVEDKKPEPVIAKPAGMDDSDYALAKEQVSWGRKNMKKQLWEMSILNFQQAKRMGLTDPAISRYIKECRSHMGIVADALERGHAAYLAGQWDEAIRQFQRARDHGEKNTTTFRMIEKAKEAKAQEAADKAK